MFLWSTKAQSLCKVFAEQVVHTMFKGLKVKIQHWTAKWLLHIGSYVMPEEGHSFGYKKRDSVPKHQMALDLAD